MLPRTIPYTLQLWSALLFGLTLTTPLRAQNVPELSPDAQVSLLTAGPGEEMYSFFGHSAIRVSDPANRIERIYNYGTFDFDQPNFYINFCRGKLLYSLDRESFSSFMKGYTLEQRRVDEQVLNLTPEECNKIFKLLEVNALPENRDYKYDFFYDNCSTRIRDILQETFTYHLIFDSSAVWQGATMRQLLRPYLRDHQWVSFGFDLVLGVPTDRAATTEQFMFLPEYLHHIVGKTNISENPVVRSDRNLLPAAAQQPVSFTDRWFFNNPMAVTSLVAIIGLFCMFNARAERIFDTFFWLILGIVGLIIAFLWFATDHQATKTNLNLFWAWPTHLLVFWRRTRTAFLEQYFSVAAIVAGLILISWTFLPQELPFAAFPIIALITIKGFWRRFTESKNISTRTK